MRDPADVMAPVAALKGADKKIKLAEQLIENWTEPDFDFAAYKDASYERLRSIIDAKAQGRKLVTAEVEEQPDVINLADALRKSLSRQPAHPARGRDGSHNRNGQRRAPSRKRKRA